MTASNSDSLPWSIGPLSTPTLQWGAIRRGTQHKCPICGVILLTGESAGFCCGRKGSHFHDVPPLPPLPPQFNTFINDPCVSSMSRALNLVFSFASLETTAEFPDLDGPPGFVAIQGRVYHRVRTEVSQTESFQYLSDQSLFLSRRFYNPNVLLEPLSSHFRDPRE